MKVSHCVQSILNQYWDRCLPIDPIYIAQRLGVEVKSESFDVNISGQFQHEEGQPVIRYNDKEPLVRQRFTIAHELGHFALNHPGGFRDNFRIYLDESVRKDIFERQANQFASELLMPEGAVMWVVKSSKSNNVYDYARRFNVSPMAMHFRVKNLGIIS